MGHVENKAYFVWGVGKCCRLMNEWYASELEKIDIIGYIDNNKGVHGKTIYNKEIFSPDILKENREAHLIIMNYYYEEIEKQIKRDYPWYEDKIEGISFLRKLQLINRYKNSQEKEIQEIVKWLQTNPLQIFNYSFVEDVKRNEHNIEFDHGHGMLFCCFQGKRIYFPSKFQNEEMVKDYWTSICVEQHIDSPHRYLTNTFAVSDGSVMVDCGAAEGFFALSNIDKCKRIYIFEPDKEWIDALKLTFEPYKNKVTIINKALSNYIDGNITTLDKEINEKVDFIKMDIEGEEFYALQGGKHILSDSLEMKIAVCTYHQEFAYYAIKKMLEESGFDIEHSKGYMWYVERFNEMRPPVLRRGVIRAVKRIPTSDN